MMVALYHHRDFDAHPRRDSSVHVRKVPKRSNDITMYTSPYSAEAAMSWLRKKDILSLKDRRFQHDDVTRFVETAADLQPLADSDSPLVLLDARDSDEQSAYANELRQISRSLPTISSPTFIAIDSDTETGPSGADYGILQTVRVPTERAEGWTTRHDIMLHTVVESAVPFRERCAALSLTRQGYARSWLNTFSLLGESPPVSATHPKTTSRMGTRTSTTDGRELCYAVLDCPEDAVRKYTDELWYYEFRGHQNKTAEEVEAAKAMMSKDESGWLTNTLLTAMKVGSQREPVKDQWRFGNLFQVRPSALTRVLRPGFAPCDWILVTADARYALRSSSSCPGAVYAQMAQMIESRHGIYRLRSPRDYLSPDTTFGRFPTRLEMAERQAKAPHICSQDVDDFIEQFDHLFRPFHLHHWRRKTSLFHAAMTALCK